MTRDDVLRIAREADLWVTRMQPYQAQIEKFAALVAAHEREACVRIVEHYTGAWSDEGYALTQAIRVRGEK
jgi:hypothetical protein